jgi:hypothetical protein
VQHRREHARRRHADQLQRDLLTPLITLTGNCSPTAGIDISYSTSATGSPRSRATHLKIINGGGSRLC